MVVKIFGILNLISGITTLIMGLYVLYKGIGKKLPYMELLFLSAAWWNFSLFFENLSTSLESHIFWTALSYPGNMFAPVFLFLFLYYYTHHNRKIPRGTLILLMVIPFLSCIFVWLPQLRVYVWKEVSVNTTPWGDIAALKHGWWYYVEAIYSYGLLVLGIFYLFRGFALFPEAYTKQIWLILGSSLVPILLNLIYTINSSRFYNFDLTSLAFTLSTVLFYLAIVKYHLFTLKPIAWDTIFRNLREGAIIIDNERIASYNAAARDILKMAGTDCKVGMPVTEAMKAQDRFSVFYNDPLNEKQEFKIGNQYFEVTKNPITDSSGQGKSMMVIFHEITEIKRKEAEIRSINEELTRSNATKDMLFKVISHDLRGPVGTIVSYLRMLVESGKSIESHKIEILYSTSENAYFMIENLLYWAIGQKNGLYLQPSGVEMKKLIAQAVRHVQILANQKGITIRNNCPDGLYGYCDANSVEIVLRNLLSNAIKFTGIGKEVTVSAFPAENRVIVETVDQGTGISDEVIRKIIDKEAIKPETGTNREVGTGIGLSLCFNLINANHGSIGFIRNKTEGTTVQVNLPAHSPE